MQKRVEVIQLRCERCRHEWFPRYAVEDIKICPKCKTPYWNVPRTGNRKGIKVVKEPTDAGFKFLGTVPLPPEAKNE